MRVLILGGTGFTGRRITHRLAQRGDEVMVVHRGGTQAELPPGVRVLLTDRHALARHAAQVKDFAPEAVVDAYALTAADVDAVLPVLPEVPAVVLSSMDVYQAFTGLNTGRELSPMPLDEDSEPRRDRYPYRKANLPGVPADYDKLDVEERWLPRGAVVLRLPMIYGPHDGQRREDVILRPGHRAARLDIRRSGGQGRRIRPLAPGQPLAQAVERSGGRRRRRGPGSCRQRHPAKLIRGDDKHPAETRLAGARHHMADALDIPPGFRDCFRLRRVRGRRTTAARRPGVCRSPSDRAGAMRRPRPRSRPGEAAGRWAHGTGGVR